MDVIGKILKIELKYPVYYITVTMYHYLRHIFSKGARHTNVRKVRRTISGLDRHHLASGNYVDNKSSNNYLDAVANSLKLLNIYGEGTLKRIPVDTDVRFIDIWSGGIGHSIKIQHPSCQTFARPAVRVKASSPPHVSRKNSSFPRVKSSP